MNATEADANMQRLIDAAKLTGIATFQRDPSRDDEKHLAYTVTANDRSTDVMMSDIPIEQWEQSFLRCYINGSFWAWAHAPDILRDALGSGTRTTLSTIIEHAERANERLVKQLGEAIGYGVMMQLAEMLWEEESKDGALSVGPRTSKLVPCSCPNVDEQLDRATRCAKCEWCCGSGRVTKRVLQAIRINNILAKLLPTRERYPDIRATELSLVDRSLLEELVKAAEE